ncbi:MAG TPA: hypothetical protein VII40_05565 [Xanthobacteraceae bacterium]
MTVTSASLLQTSALESPSPAIRRIAVVLTSLVAGAVGCVIAYWTWRMVLKIPLGLEPDLRLGAVNAPSQGTPGAPWWVPSAIVGAVAMLLWPILAAHARRISLLGGSAAIVLVSLLIFPIAAMCVEITALTHNGWPSVVELVGAMPRMIIEAVRITFLNLIYCGLITVPAAALIGLLLAACGRLMVWMVDRVSGSRTADDAG